MLHSQGALRSLVRQASALASACLAERFAFDTMGHPVRKLDHFTFKRLEKAFQSILEDKTRIGRWFKNLLEALRDSQSSQLGTLVLQRDAMVTHAIGVVFHPVDGISQFHSQFFLIGGLHHQSSEESPPVRTSQLSRFSRFQDLFCVRSVTFKAQVVKKNRYWINLKARHPGTFLFNRLKSLLVFRVRLQEILRLKKIYCLYTLGSRSVIELSNNFESKSGNHRARKILEDDLPARAFSRWSHFQDLKRMHWTFAGL